MISNYLRDNPLIFPEVSIKLFEAHLVKATNETLDIIV